MTAATLTGVFKVQQDAEIRELATGDPVVTLQLTYAYGGRQPEGHRPTQWVEAGLWGSRATKLAPRLVAHSLIFAVIEEVHVEAYTNASGATGHKLVGRLGRVDVIADPMMTGLNRPKRA
jgi:single-strand DNA-binding protein